MTGLKIAISIVLTMCILMAAFWPVNDKETSVTHRVSHLGAWVTAMLAIWLWWQ